MMPTPTELVARLLADSELARQRGEYVIGAALALEAAHLAAANQLQLHHALALRLYAEQQLRIGELELAVQACEDSAAMLRVLPDGGGAAAGQADSGGAAADAADSKQDSQDGQRTRVQRALCETQLVHGVILLELGLHPEALDCLNEARDLAGKTREEVALFWVYNRLGVAYSYMGQFEQAEGFLLDALARSDSLDDEAQFSVLNNLADTAVQSVLHLRELGETALAEVKTASGLMFARDALDIASRSINPYRHSLAAGVLGALLGLSGDHRAALAEVATAREIAHAREYAFLELTAELYHAQITLWSGRAGGAANLLVEVIAHAEQRGDLTVQLNALRQLSWAYERMQDYRLALQTYKRLRSLELQLRSSVADTRARLMARHLDLDEARLQADRARTESAGYRARRDQLENDLQLLQVRADKLEQDAHQDPLTGIGDRRHLDLSLDKLWAAAADGERQLALAIIDIDHFKAVNDTFGHNVGDEVLVRVAQLLLRYSRSADVVGRFGGEEFLLVLMDTDLPTAKMICERVRSGIENENWESIRPGLAVTVSLGVSSWDGSRDRAQLLNRADEELYRAKAGGRNRVRIAS